MAEKNKLTARIKKEIERFLNSVFVRQDGASTMTGAIDINTSTQASGNRGNDITHEADASVGPLIRALKGRASGAVVVSGDVLFQITALGSSGSSVYEQGATLKAIVDGTPGVNDMPTKWVFATSPDGTDTAVDRVEIGQDGILNANTYGIRTEQSVANFSSPPTDAELNAAFGTPETLGRGFVATIDDADGDTTCWLVFTSDASWFYEAMTKAV